MSKLTKKTSETYLPLCASLTPLTHLFPHLKKIPQDQGSKSACNTTKTVTMTSRNLYKIFHGVTTKLQIAENSRTILHRFIPDSLFFKELPGERLFEIPDEERLLRTDSL